MVFIVGFPRSGTTYLQSLLCTQPSWVSMPETHFFSYTAKDLPKVITSKQELEGYIERTREGAGYKPDDVWFENLRKNLNEKGISKKDLFFNLIQSHFQASSKIGKANFIEKTPRHLDHVSEILDMFPNAKVICIFRHPHPSIMSYLKNITHVNTSYLRLARRWKNETWSAQKHALNTPESFHIIRYEDLIQKRSEEMRKIMDFLNEDLSEENLDNYKLEASRVILDYEVWKSANKRSDYSTRPQKVALSMDLLRGQRIMLKGLRRLNYKIYYPVFTMVYVIAWNCKCWVRSIIQAMLKTKDVPTKAI